MSNDPIVEKYHAARAAFRRKCEREAERTGETVKQIEYRMADWDEGWSGGVDATLERWIKSVANESTAERK